MVRLLYPIIKLFLIPGFLLTLFFACNKDKGADHFIISGKFEEYGGTEVSLMRQTGLDWEVVDKTTLDKNGKFSFEGQLSLPEFVYLVTGEEKGFVRFFLENSDISISVPKGSHLNDAQITGSYTHDKFAGYNQIDKSEFSDSLYAIYREWNEANAGGDNQSALDLDSLREEVNNKRLGYQVEFIRENFDNILGPFVLNIVFQTMDTAQLEPLIELLDPSIEESIYTMQVKQKLAALRATQVGKPFINISLPDSTGKIIQLSDLVSRGNFLVVDFWAVWSGGSLLEIEKKKELYMNYYDRGLQLVSISFDNDIIKWKKFIEESRMPWLQLIDSKGPRGKVAIDYLITGLPFKFIFDPEGNILAKVQSVDELEEELVVIFE